MFKKIHKQEERQRQTERENKRVLNSKKKMSN
jgi:hypothetical protein